VEFVFVPGKDKKAAGGGGGGGGFGRASDSYRWAEARPIRQNVFPRPAAPDGRTSAD
jgi:hypothetical protein